jgi:hypothetical protein
MSRTRSNKNGRDDASAKLFEEAGVILRRHASSS